MCHAPLDATPQPTLTQMRRALSETVRVSIEECGRQAGLGFGPL